MAFELYNWSCVSGSMNQGLVTAAIATPSSDSSVAQGSMNLFSYYSVGDALATIEASNYFLPVIYDLQPQDVIMVTGSDASVFLQVETVTLPSGSSSGTVTTQTFTAAGTVGTSNISNLAVTTAKIALLAVTAAQIANNTVDYAQLALDVSALQVTAFTNAELLGMYTTPKIIVAAQGSGTIAVLDSYVIDYAYSTAATAAGGLITAQYGSTDHAGGVICSAGIPAATLNGLSASGQLIDFGAPCGAANTVIENAAIYLSNASGAFTTGSGTANVYAKFHVLTPS